MNQESCLDYEALEAWAAGQDRGPAAERHLQHCAACRELADRIDENNRLMRQVAGAAGKRRRANTPPAGNRPAIPGYELSEEVGRGGQGVVYKAVQLATRRDVAIKVLLAGRLATPQQRNRFEREIEIVAALRHPFLVTVYDSGITQDGFPYFVMEHIDGQPLHAYAEAVRSRSQGPAPLRSLLDLFLKVCDGMTMPISTGSSTAT